MSEDAGPGADPIAEMSTQSPAPKPKRRAPRLARGTCIGRYVVIDVLGAGGMGVVYRAYDPELDRRIALKLVRDGRSDPSRLVAEAQALARVSHPNVVHVYDVGTFGDQVFIAMELVLGRTVHGWRAETSPPPSRRQLLEVFFAAGRGLAAAHRAGIVHRDFKPSNVMVGDDGRVRVADFGLARAGDLTPPDRTPPELGAARTSSSTPRERPLDRARAESTAEPVITAGSTESESTSRTVDDPFARSAAFVGAAGVVIPDDAGDDVDADLPDDDDLPSQPSTASGTASSLPRVHASRVMGTPSYMAPEQVRGARDVGPAADVFSWRCPLERHYAATERPGIAGRSGTRKRKRAPFEARFGSQQNGGG